MEYNTIDGNVTIPAGGVGALLAGRYRVVRQLGQGGMGSVWLAEDTQLDNKLFAIKMLPSILVSNKRAYQQLKTEALVAMKLVHPNIVQLRAFEENDGNPFLVMDYVDGQTLDDYLVEEGNGELGMGNGLSESEVLRLLKPIAAALDYAHGKGIVHRDVKPGNVMVAKDGTPYILDFGIAREIQETMTRVTGKLSSGTLLYMSPEQLNGDAPTKEQDVYSFAAMAYECLKGEPPFARGNIEFQIMNKAPEPLAGSGVSAAPLAVGIMFGLAKKPEDRPATCAAVLKGDLSDHVEREERVAGGVDDSGHKEQKERKEQKGGVGKVLVAAALLAALACGAWWWQGERNVTDGTTGTNATATIPVPPVPTYPTESDVTDIAVEATVQKARVERIDDADGFKEKKDALSDDLTRATANEKVKRWADAAQGFTNYVDDCKVLLALDKERHAARESKSKAEAAKNRASEVGASQYAKPLWDATIALLEEASGKFDSMAFAEAAQKYDTAVSQFDICVTEANAERKRQEDEAAAQAKAEQEKREREAAEAKAKAEREAPRNGECRTLTLPGDVKMEMIYVAPGSFTMGSPSSEDGHEGDETQHRVTLTKGYWLGKYEVTQRQWESVMGNNPSYFKGGDRPVENVSWKDCQEFCRKVNDAAIQQFGGGARLPTEAEWEYACRAGTTTAFSWGNALNGDKANCNGNYPCGTTVKGCYREQTADVGSYSPNVWGFYDMHGNVWEWCSDWYGSYGGDATDPIGPAPGEFRVLRGGGWLRYARYCRSAFRNRHNPGLRFSGYGFRLCCSAGPRGEAEQ